MGDASLLERLGGALVMGAWLFILVVMEASGPCM